MAARGSQITRQDYNNIRRVVFNVLGAGGTNPITNVADATFGYGQTLLSSEIPSVPDQTITEQQWDRLRLDISRAYTHQVGSSPNIPDVAGSILSGNSATIISYDSVYQTYKLAADDIVTNRNLFAGSQKPQTPVTVVNGTKTLTTAWSDSVKQTVSVTFNSAAEARYFFNSGATINFRSSRTGGTIAPQNAAAQNNSWTSFLNNVVGTVSFGRNQFYALTSGGLAPEADPVFFFAAPAPYSNNYFRIKANCNSPTNVNGTATFISFEIEWIDATTIPLINTDLIDGNLTCVISETKSIGALTLQSPVAYNIGELSPSGTAINLAASFALTSNVDVVDEGANVTFTLTSRNYPAGKAYQLEILGVSDADLQGSTTGIKTITTAGNDTLATANYTVTIRADQLTDPGESITARITIAADAFQSGEILTKTVVINDTSKTPTPTLSISSTTANSIQNEDFGSDAVVTLTNTGNRVLNVTGVNINKGSNLTDLSANFTNLSGSTTFSATTIAAGANKTFTVKFKGNIVGTQTAVVTVTSDGNDVVGGGPLPGSTKTGNISVSVITATYGLTTTPLLSYTASYSSDGITAGETPLQTIRLSNSTGNATIQLGSPAVTISGQGSLVPTVVGDPSGLTIAPGSFREFQVKFAGLTVPLTQPVTISIDGGSAGTRTILATITGTASLPAIVVSTTAITGSPTRINVQDTKTFTISNTGSAQLNVTNIAVAGQNSFSTVTVTPTSLTIPAGSPSQTITVRTQRSRIGTDTATITITSNAPAGDATKTVSVSMSSTALTPTYYAKMTSGTTVTSTSGIATGKRGDADITVYFAGAEPNADYFGYHQQASGVITGLPAGTSAQQAFSQQINKKSADGTGRVNYWPSLAGELSFWDVGVSKFFAWVPVGKRDDGTQVWMDLPGSSGGQGGGTIQFEVFPNPTISFTPGSFQYSNIEYNPSIAGQPVPTFSNGTLSVTNGFQNQTITLNATWHGSPTKPLSPVTLNSAGGYTDSKPVAFAFNGNAHILWPGVYSITGSQTYKGVTYQSPPAAITVTSAGYSALGLPANYAGLPANSTESLMMPDACWVNAGTASAAGIWYRYFRSVVLTPGASYELRAWSDDYMWVGADTGIQQVLGGYSANLGSGVSRKTFTMPSGQGSRLLITWVVFNDGQFGNVWSTNPGWFSLQVWQGTSKIWGTSQSTGAGF
jgi:hypothetical protein